MAVDWPKFLEDPANNEVLTVVGFQRHEIRFFNQWRRMFWLNRPKAQAVEPTLAVYYVTDLRWELVPGSTKAGITLRHRRFTWTEVLVRGPIVACQGMNYYDQHVQQMLGTYVYLGLGPTYPAGERGRPVSPLYFLDDNDPVIPFSPNVCGWQP